METVNLTIKIIAGIAVVGAIVETFVPGLITEKLQNDFSAITICLIGILFSYYLLIVILKVRIREGFEDAASLTRWKSLVDQNKIKDVCATYTDMYDKMYTVEKGAAPGEVQTDSQARGAVSAKFREVMMTDPLSCPLFEEVNTKATSLDSLYLAIQKLPDTFLVQVYETAIGCRILLIQQYLKVTDAENKKAEAFQDIALCSDKAAEERKAFKERKPLSEEAQKCLLVEEVPENQKKFVVDSKLNRLEEQLETYRKASKVKDSLEKILQDCAYYKGELEKKKKDAEDKSNKYNW